MTSKTKLAVLVAALFMGAQAGIAALDQEASATLAEATEATQEQQTAEATTEAAPAEAPEVTAAAEQPAPEAPVAAPARIAHIHASKTFPRSPDGRDMLPGLAAYLEQVEASRSHLVARGDAFPRSPDGRDMLPALASYLDQRDATRLARAEAQTIAAVAAGGGN